MPGTHCDHREHKGKRNCPEVTDCGWKCTSEVAAETVGDQKKEAEVEEEDNTLHLVEPQLKKKKEKNSTLMTAEDGI